MIALDKNYIGGEWAENGGQQRFEMVNPATAQAFGHVALSSEADVSDAVAAAKSALPEWRDSSRQDRLDLIARIGEALKARMPDLIAAIVEELGAPVKLTKALHVPAGLMQVAKWTDVLEAFEFTQKRGNNLVSHDPVGVVALITSWNYPVNGPFGVLLPALAAGCTVIWKPSEMAAHSAKLLTEVLDAARVPPGLFNMVQGDGTAGHALVTHEDVAMVSFTGSGATGARIATAVAPQMKRLVLELGGKSAYVVLDGADLEASVKDCMGLLLRNSGQTCTTPSRLIVPRARMDEVTQLAAAIASGVQIGEPSQEATQMGPLRSADQRKTVEDFIAAAVQEGSRRVTDGTGVDSPGFFVRPTVFADVDPRSRVAQEEVFGPVLAIIPHDGEEHAVSVANATRYGLSAYIMAPDVETARRVGGRMEVGMVHLNGAPVDLSLPFGGVKSSGLGRKLGPEGLLEYLETKSIYID